MDLAELLSAMDRAAANLAKLERIWERAAPFMPTGPARGSNPEYDDLCRAWSDVLTGLPPLDGWTVTEQLPDIDDLGQMHIDYWEMGEHPHAVYDAVEQPSQDLAEYRFRLNRARRRAARERLQRLTTVVDTVLPRVVDGVPRDSTTVLSSGLVEEVRRAVGEIERLMGDTAQRRGRWRDLHRHMSFSEGHDWHDVLEFDWPSVRANVEAAGLADTDPVSVPDIDLGKAASGDLTGVATIALPWERLDDDAFNVCCTTCCATCRTIRTSSGSCRPGQRIGVATSRSSGSCRTPRVVCGLSA